MRAENEEKRSTLRKKENTGNCPFENIGFYLVIYSVFKKSFLGTKKPLKTLKFKDFSLEFQSWDKIGENLG